MQIAIQTTEGPDTVDAIVVDGVDPGLFVVNRDRPIAGVEFWAITHAPTGWAVLHLRHRYQAIAAAKDLYTMLYGATIRDDERLFSRRPKTVYRAIPEAIRQWCRDRNRGYREHLIRRNPGLFNATLLPEERKRYDRHKHRRDRDD